MKYYLWNNTDNIPGPCRTGFEDEQKAESYIAEWKKRLNHHQGYYKDGNGERIPVDQVDIVPLPLGPEDVRLHFFT